MYLQKMKNDIAEIQAELEILRIQDEELYSEVQAIRIANMQEAFTDILNEYPRLSFNERGQFVFDDAQICEVSLRQYEDCIDVSMNRIRSTWSATLGVKVKDVEHFDLLCYEIQGKVASKLMTKTPDQWHALYIKNTKDLHAKRLKLTEKRTKLNEKQNQAINLLNTAQRDFVMESAQSPDGLTFPAPVTLNCGYDKDFYNVIKVNIVGQTSSGKTSEVIFTRQHMRWVEESDTYETYLHEGPVQRIRTDNVRHALYQGLQHAEYVLEREARRKTAMEHA